jgi:Tol biopolymer transport system component
MKKGLLFLMLLSTMLIAQVSVINTQTIQIGKDVVKPSFSEDGTYIIFNSDDGLYTYDIDAKKTVRFAENGYDPIMDDNGVIRYRVDNYEKGYRLSSFSVYDTKTNKTELVVKNKRLNSAPVITNHGVYFIENKTIKNNFAKATQPSEPVAFTYQNKVILYSYGTSRILAPAGDNPHLWPSVSPEHNKLCVVGGNDLYICDLKGNVLSMIENARAPKWSPDGKWIAFMRDTDDGTTITGSDVYLASSDGQNIIQLTNSIDQFEMYPNWSPDGKYLICDNPADGQPILITLEIK